MNSNSQPIRDKYESELQTLAKEAITNLKHVKGPIIQFCGPISTGGLGNVQDNIDVLASFIEYAKIKNIPVFDQISYERKLDTILKRHEGYDYPLLDFFYKPIFQSGIISALIFLPLWETSVGAKWENAFAKSIGIPVYYIEDMTTAEICNIYSKIKKVANKN